MRTLTLLFALLIFQIFSLKMGKLSTDPFSNHSFFSLLICGRYAGSFMIFVFEYRKKINSQGQKRLGKLPDNLIAIFKIAATVEIR